MAFIFIRRENNKVDIIIKDLSKSYKKNIVFNNLNLKIKENKTTCIMGASGVGKTTLLRILLGLVKSDSGSIEGLEGKKITAVFQENRLVENINSIKNIQLVCEKSLSIKRISHELDQVGLKGFEMHPINQLSGGMKRRVAIVRGLIGDFDIVIMDEPFKGLDIELKDKVIEYVKDKTKNKTVIIVTHDINEVKKLNANKIQLNFTNKNRDGIISE